MKMADEAVEKALAETRERVERTRQEGAERLSKGKPTPSQEENDRAALGEVDFAKEDDGSGPDAYAAKNLEAQRHAQRGGYQTRQVAPQRTTPRTTGGGAGSTS
jgi:hypothetical protein